MYTDGLVEVRDEAVDQGLERLRRAACEPAPDLERLCDHVVTTLTEREHPDDIALMAARMLPLGREVATHWPASVDALKRIRSFLRRWLRERGATEEET